MPVLHTNRLKSLGASLLIAMLGLSACVPQPAPIPKEPAVSFAPVYHDAVYPNRMVILPKSQQKDLKTFLSASTGLQGSNTITLALPNISEQSNMKRLQDVQGLITAWGVHANMVVLEDATVPTGHVRIIAAQVVGGTNTECPDWRYGQMANYRNAVLSNHGCTTAHNLAKMVEDPLDLVGAGANTGKPDAGYSADVVRTYRASGSSAASASGATPTSGGGS